MRRLVYLLIVSFYPLYGQPLKVTTQAKAAILINAETGAVLYEKNADLLCYPASTTKIATLLFALEGKKVDLDQVVTVSKEAVSMLHASVKQAAFDRYPSHILEHDGTMMGLRKGQKLTVHELLHGLMLMSGNDAANTLAEVCSGSVETFMQEMREFLKGLGLKATYLNNPHGLHHPQQVATAREFALLTSRALRNPIFRHIVRLSQYESPSGLQMIQGNRLVKKGPYHYPKAIGVKTGRHARAGCNLVAAAEDQGRLLIAVLFGCETPTQRYKEAIELFEAAFNEKRVIRTLFAADTEAFSLELPKADRLLKAQLHEDLTIEYFPAEEPRLRAEVQWKKLTTPIFKGQLVGCVKVISDDERIVKAAPLYALHPVKTALFYRFLSALKWLVPLLLFAPFLFIKEARKPFELLKRKLLRTRLPRKP